MKDELGVEKCVINKKLKFENYINYLESTQIDNKRNYREKNKIVIDSFEKNHKQFIRNNKSILKT